ncbi:MAG: hypothetical protein HKN87_00060 [Saprospiraceae bacterium]|nr:hypothetical protein [Saprospiraceae bacterium]
MKTNNFKYFVILIFSMVLLFASCKKDDEIGPAQVTFAFDFTVDGESLVFGETYIINNQSVSFKTANYYIGGLRLQHSDGSTIDLSTQYLLAGLGNTATLSGDVPIGDITKAEFFVGVDPVNNTQSEDSFVSRPTNDPLGIKDPSMHWNWNTGYKFVRFDGEVDTDDDGVVDTPIAYHLGSDPLLTNMNINKTLNLKSGENTITFDFQLEQFFSSVDFKNELDTHTGNNLPLAMRLRDNLDAAITLR